MLFRIEDTENIYGNHREYEIPYERLPLLRLSNVEDHIAQEIRKQVNNSKNRSLLSYSKSLGICLLKYNSLSDNPLYIMNRNAEDGFIEYYNENTLEYHLKDYDLSTKIRFKKEKKIKLSNFMVDISKGNSYLNDYLLKKTGKALKKYASPQKDKEVLIMQSSNNIIIEDYLASIYTLYALYLKYSMNIKIYESLIEEISKLPEFHFQCCGESEREGILLIIDYLYCQGNLEIEMSKKIVEDRMQNDDFFITYTYNPLIQLFDTLSQSFEEAYSLSDYNDNIVSDWIWEIYKREITGNIP